jgi:HD superfamily phosphohydrolase
LGVVHWVYPSACHCRFEHSLGVLHQVEQIANSINRSTQEKGDPEALKVEHKALLRFAALCHDLGHGTMSHVVEHAISEFDEIEILLMEFADEQGVEKPSLSETVAFQILGTDAFRRLFETAKKKAKGIVPPDDAISKAQNMIIGKIVDPQMPSLQGLISGPFDADKLDYMQRDALMSGVPAITDVPRLVQKIRARWMREDQLPEKVEQGIAKGFEDYLLFGISFSGSRTLDELLIARVLLFDKVYRHQKVRALEGMVARLYQALSRAYKGSIFELPYLFGDETLLDADLFIDQRTDFNFASYQVERAVVSDLCRRLRDRLPFVRAFVFGLHFKELDEDAQSSSGMTLLKHHAEGAKREKLVKDIASELTAVLEVLNPELLAQLPDKSLVSYLWIDPPTTTDHGQKVGHAYLFKEDDQIVAYSEHSTEVSHWSTGYLSKKDVGYIFTIPELRVYAFLAIEKLTAEKYSLRIPKSSLTYLKTQANELADPREHLRAKGYYSPIAYSLRPLPLRLYRRDAQRTYAQVLANLRGYEGPQIDAGSVVLDERRVELWVSQFETEDQIEVALAAVKVIQICGRGNYTTALRTFLEQNASTFGDFSVCALGDAKDSGNIVAYCSGDLGISPLSFKDCIASGKPIILLDDFIGSGGQGRTIVADWYADPDRALTEGRRTKLTQEEQRRLSEIPLAFVFAAGWSEGMKELLEACREKGINSTGYIYQEDRVIPSIFNDQFKVLPGHNAFLDRARDVARQLLKVRHPDWRDDKLEQRLLGYGNQGLLLTFPHNTPSQTLTCLWESGTYNGQNWTPLLPRRAKR